MVGGCGYQDLSRLVDIYGCRDDQGSRRDGIVWGDKDRE